jgi:hypothetical protein
LSLVPDFMKIALAGTGNVVLSNAILLAQHNEDLKMESDPDVSQGRRRQAAEARRTAARLMAISLGTWFEYF